MLVELLPERIRGDVFECDDDDDFDTDSKVGADDKDKVVIIGMGDIWSVLSVVFTRGDLAALWSRDINASPVEI